MRHLLRTLRDLARHARLAGTIVGIRWARHDMEAARRRLQQHWDAHDAIVADIVADAFEAPPSIPEFLRVRRQP